MYLESFIISDLEWNSLILSSQHILDTFSKQSGRGEQSASCKTPFFHLNKLLWILKVGQRWIRIILDSVVYLQVSNWSRTQSGASCLLIGCASKEQEVDFAEWKSFIRSRNRRRTCRKHRI